MLIFNELFYTDAVGRTKICTKKTQKKRYKIYSEPLRTVSDAKNSQGTLKNDYGQRRWIHPTRLNAGQLILFVKKKNSLNI